LSLLSVLCVCDLCRRTQLLLSFIALCPYNWQYNKCNQSQIRALSRARIVTRLFGVWTVEKKVPHHRTCLPALLISDSFYYFRFLSHLLYIIWFSFLLVLFVFSSVDLSPIFLSCINLASFSRTTFLFSLKIVCALIKMLATFRMFQFFLSHCSKCRC